ncbi:hypothetical protein KIN20_030450 [Parelaphostrongylus tenuis]|uniref:Uncharacterized protein n=1 Tax=Parelaphostrongylus tenuis TaxID=148309 RepID=A0AAD5WGB3_PARTN|nr:hypothetical protein KIN20_030450 [Parelaphostrongylus tenuis]
MKDMPSCIIVGNTVTGICTTMMRDNKMCMKEEKDMVVITPLDGTYFTIRGNLSSTNIVMANWSRMMWQSVVDRAVRMLASGPVGSHFIAARATLCGN